MINSPFSKQTPTFGREPTIFQKIWYFCQHHLNEWFITYMPSDDIKQMPPTYFYPVGILLFLILSCIFFTIFSTNYSLAIQTKFLAPLDYHDHEYCHTVPITTTGTFYASKDGFWQSETQFDYSRASYLFDLNNADFTIAQYQQIMATLWLELEAIGKKAKTLDLGQNLLLWIMYSFEIINTESLDVQGLFYFTGTAENIFNRQKTSGCISNLYVDCRTKSDGFFDEANGIMEVNYEYESYQQDPQCRSIIAPEAFGYTSYANPSNFEISVDVQSLIASVSVNLQLIPITDLEMVAGTERTITYQDDNYQFAQYYDPKFPNMKPMTCFSIDQLVSDQDTFHTASGGRKRRTGTTNSRSEREGNGHPTSHSSYYANPTPSTSSYRCLLIVDGIFALPIFNHVGNNTDYPIPCNCSSLTMVEKSNPLHQCNRFLFITGLLFYNTTSQIQPLVELLQNYDYQQINQLAYYPMFLASVWGYTSPYQTTLFQNLTYRESFYQFCNTTYGTCSFVTFSSFDLKNPTWEISSYYYQVPTGACQDTFSPTPEAWNQLVEIPFAPLIQEYQTCRNDPTVILFQEAGIAFGNMSIMTPIAVIVVLALTFIYQCCSGKYIPKSYSTSEKTDALDSFAVALLLARDKKLLDELKMKHGVDRESILSRYSSTFQPSEDLMNSLNQNCMIDGLVKELEVIAQLSEKQYRRESNVGLVDWKAFQDKYLPKRAIQDTSAEGQEMTSFGDPSPSMMESNPMHQEPSSRVLQVLNDLHYQGNHDNLLDKLIALDSPQDELQQDKAAFQQLLQQYQEPATNYMQQHHPHLISTQKTILSLIHQFEVYLQTTTTNTSEVKTSQYWTMIHKTKQLRQFKLPFTKRRLFEIMTKLYHKHEMTSEVEAELMEVLITLWLLAKCLDLLLLHTCVHLQCKLNQLLPQHYHSMSYVIMNDIWTLAELQVLLKIWCPDEQNP